MNQNLNLEAHSRKPYALKTVALSHDPNYKTFEEAEISSRTNLGQDSSYKTLKKLTKPLERTWDKIPKPLGDEHYEIPNTPSCKLLSRAEAKL